MEYSNNTALFDFGIALKNEREMKLSKREILSALAGIFDPLSLLHLLEVGVKVLFQQLYKEKTGWDDKIAYRGTLNGFCDV